MYSLSMVTYSLSGNVLSLNGNGLSLNSNVLSLNGNVLSLNGNVLSLTVTHSLSSGSVQHGVVALLHDDASTTLLALFGLLLTPPVMLALDSVHTIIDAPGALSAECVGAMGCQPGVLARHTIHAGTTVVGRAVAAIPAHCYRWC